MKTDFFNKLAGTVIVFAAVILIGFKAEWWKFGFNPDSVWTLIIAVPFLIWMLVLGINIVNTLGFYAGLGLLIYNNGFVDERNIKFFIILLAMMSVGTFLTGHSYKYISPTTLKPSVLSRTSPKISVFAGMKHIQNRFDGVIGGTFKVFSGSLLYDFTKAKIDHKTEMTVKIRFGKLYIVFPENIMVQSDVNGNFTNGLAAPKDYEGIINIKGTVKFGKLFIISQSQENI